jgi:CcmD family protein
MKDEAQGAELTVESRSQEFVPVQGSTETTSAESILVAAYICFWLVVFVFIFLTKKKQAELERRLEGIERALEKTAPTLDKSALGR